VSRFLPLFLEKDFVLMDVSVKNRGVQVTLAAVGINLSLGILYTWSVFSKAIPSEWGWTEADKSLPYSVACLVFSLAMVPAGRLQDRFGPRLVATFGGLLVGIGMILASQTVTFMGYVVGFGLLAGAGIGFGYASATPPAIKWFPAARTGTIVGLVVSGFGLSPVYAAPLAKWMIGVYGLPHTVLALGIAFLLIVVLLSQLLVQPPKGFVPGILVAQTSVAAAVQKKDEFHPTEMLATVQFHLLCFMYACGAGAGLMIISKLAKIGDEQADFKQGFVLVAAMAVGNGVGRIVTGSLSDKLGRRNTLLGCFIMQACLMFVLSLVHKDSVLANSVVLIILSALLGANYGANLAVFPSITKHYYGLKNFGVNYGLLFTAWGLGGFLLPLLAGKLHDIYGSFTFAYYTAIAFLLLAAVMTCIVKPPHVLHEAAADPPQQNIG
jgi:OFA family oxalate/formate antiporter-like MFS transporter